MPTPFLLIPTLAIKDITEITMSRCLVKHVPQALITQIRGLLTKLFASHALWEEFVDLRRLMIWPKAVVAWKDTFVGMARK